MEVPARQRNPFIDYLKGIAILLVLYGHSIQYSNGEHNFLQNPGFKFIYMFHMPLFALLSGYVSVTIAHKSFRELFVSKLKQLYIPSVAWTWLGIAAVSIPFVLLTGKMPYVQFTLSGYWFITTIILCSFALWGVLRLAGNKRIVGALALTCLLALLLPDLRGGELKMFKFLFPFFALGYCINRYEDIFKRNKVRIGLVGFILFVVCFCLWKTNDFVYTTPSTLYGTNNGKVLASYALRLLAGISGSAMVICLLSYCYKSLFFARITALGCCTFTIYMIQQIIFDFIFRLANYTSFQFSPYIYNGIVVPAITVTVLLCCICTIRVLSRSEFLSKWLLGKSKPGTGVRVN